MLYITCGDVNYDAEDANSDCFTFWWTNAPEGAAKQFRQEWFQRDGMIRRKNIEYNPQTTPRPTVCEDQEQTYSLPSKMGRVCRAKPRGRRPARFMMASLGQQALPNDGGAMTMKAKVPRKGRRKIRGKM